MVTLLISYLVFPILWLFGLTNVNKIFSIFAVFAVGFLIAINRHNQDYEGYVGIFENPWLYAEPGYSLLVEILKKFGFSDHNSVIFVLAVFVAVTFLRMVPFTKSFYILCFLYFIFWLPVDVTQIRNTFASFFVINAFLFFANKRYVWFIILLFGSVFLHYFAILFVFLSILAVFFKFSTRNVVLMVCAIPFSYYFIFYFSSLVDIRNFSAYLVSSPKFSSLLNWGVALAFLLTLVSYFFAKCQLIMYEKDERFVGFCLSLGMLSIAALPGLVWVYDFNRIYRLVFFCLLLSVFVISKYLIAKDRGILLAFSSLIPIVYGVYYASILDFDYIYWG